MRKNRSTFVFALAYVVFVAGVFLALGGSAYAADGNPTSAGDQYDPPKVEVVVPPTDTRADVNVSEPFLPPVAETEVADVAQTLPNTGLSLLATAVIGGALVAFGVALRRRERRNG